MKRAAAGRFRGSVAHPAACWEQDTIPCADAQGGPESSPAPNGNRMQPGRCATLCDISFVAPRMNGSPFCPRLSFKNRLGQTSIRPMAECSSRAENLA
jgi:hypothetical protein